MARFIDDLYSQGFTCSKERGIDPVAVAEVLQNAVVIDATNVATFYYEGTGQEQWDEAKDFPNMAPPWESFWIESRAPKTINSEVIGDKQWGYCPEDGRNLPQFAPTRWGTLFVAMKPEGKLKEDCPDAHWMLTTYLFLDIPAIKGFGLWMCNLFMIGGDGALQLVTGEDGKRNVRRLSNFLYTNHLNRDEIFKVTQDLCNFIYVGLLAISFMHCKNTQITAHDPAPKVQKKRERKGQQPLVKFHTVEIEPMRKQLRDAGSETDIKKALHICRGHFAVYTKENPLFGKFVGTVWRASHTRGSTSQGKVIKDYSVSP